MACFESRLRTEASRPPFVAGPGSESVPIDRACCPTRLPTSPPSTHGGEDAASGAHGLKRRAWRVAYTPFAGAWLSSLRNAGPEPRQRGAPDATNRHAAAPRASIEHTRVGGMKLQGDAVRIALVAVILHRRPPAVLAPRRAPLPSCAGLASFCVHSCVWCVLACGGGASFGRRGLGEAVESWRWCTLRVNTGRHAPLGAVGAFPQLATVPIHG
jgi:hypothetical protein